MKQLTEEEAANIPGFPPTRYCTARLYLMNMKVGDIILLEKKDFTWKGHTPHTLLNRMWRRERWHFSCRTALDGSGWVIKRFK